jgi:hypothetical protein
MEKRFEPPRRQDVKFSLAKGQHIIIEEAPSMAFFLACGARKLFLASWCLGGSNSLKAAYSTGIAG